MMYAGKTPWHGLGTPVEKEVTSEAAIRLGGLDWDVEKRPIYLGKEGVPMKCLSCGEKATVTALGQKLETHVATVRAEDNKLLGVVGDTYELIQNKDAFGFLDGLVGEGLAMYHACGSLYDGRRVFITCRLPDSLHIGPDQIDKYLVACTSHDGSLALHIKWTPIRVICWNTLSAAFNIHGGRVKATDCVSVRHTLNYRERITQAREVLNLTDLYYERLEECFQRLIKTPCTTKQFKNFSLKLWPDRAIKDDDEKKRTNKRREDVRKKIQELFVAGAGNSQKDVRGTRWAAYNAVTEFVDHHKKVLVRKDRDEADVRMQSIVWGNGSHIKQRALQLLTV